MHVSDRPEITLKYRPRTRVAYLTMAYLRLFLGGIVGKYCGFFFILIIRFPVVR